MTIYGGQSISYNIEIAIIYIKMNLYTSYYIPYIDIQYNGSLYC